MERAARTRADGGAPDVARATRRGTAASPPRSPPGSPAHVLALQRTAGNRAVVQRTELLTKSGSLVTDHDGPGTNLKKEVLAVQERLLALKSIPEADFAAEHDKVAKKGDTDPVLAADIPRTTAAIDRNEGPQLEVGPALGVLKAAVLGGVGTGQANNATDVELVLNLLHEEWHVTNDDYDRGVVVLAGPGATVDPAVVPGFLAGLTKLKRYFVAGYPFRGTTATRKRPVAPDGPDQEAYEKAIAHNIKERAVMLSWLAEAKAQRKDVMLRNSAQWCTTGKIVLFTLTTTHDSVARAKGSGKKGEKALFSYPGGPLPEPPVPYTRKPKGTATFVNTDVDFQVSTVAGFHTGNHIALLEPSFYGKQQFFSFVKHEAQHDADKSGGSDEERYKSEFRAYSLTGTFNHLSPKKKVKRLGHTWNERQFGVFQHLMTDPAYAYVRKNWNTNVAGWRAMVVAFKTPESINPINSVRIENLREAIEACSTADCLADDRNVDNGQPRDPKAAAVGAAMAALDGPDRKAIPRNVELNKLAQDHLAGRTKAEYSAIR